jgi:hypothetical protein
MSYPNPRIYLGGELIAPNVSLGTVTYPNLTAGAMVYLNSSKEMADLSLSTSLGLTAGTLDLGATIYVDDIAEKTTSNGTTINNVTLLYATPNPTIRAEYGILKVIGNSAVNFLTLFGNGVETGYSSLGINAHTSGDSILGFYHINTEASNIVSDGTTLKFNTNNAATLGMTIGGAGEIFFPEAYGDSVTGVALYIDSNGQIGQTTSILASKTNIKDINDYDWLYKIKPKKFNFKKKIDDYKWSDSEYNLEESHGFIAEEVEKYKPELCNYIDVKKHKDGCKKESNCGCPKEKKLYGIKYTEFIPYLLACIQELKKTKADA